MAITKKKIIVGNWKMNFDVHEASLYLHKLSGMVELHRDVEVVLAPTLLTIQSLSLQVDLKQFKLAAQNFYWRDHGTYTGEVSAAQLRGIVQYALVGHSERRNIFHETNKDIGNKVQAAIRNNIKPILIIGETAWERSSGETNLVLHDQLAGGLVNITSDDLKNVIIAYEPVWADGTGNNAPVEEVAKAVRAIRKQIDHLYGKDAANDIKVLYGGSVTDLTAESYLNMAEIDGLLIGNVSLHAHAFSEIIKKAHKGYKVAKKE